MAETRVATSQGLLTLNMVFRVALASTGTVASWVPLRILSSHGEFAAVVFIVTVGIYNVFTILNAILWHSDDWTTWWDGTGLCDIEVYAAIPLQTIYAASIFTIVYNLAQQVKVTGTGHGRQRIVRRNFVHAAIIFPIPLFQVLFTYFDLSQRYSVGTLVGCFPSFDISWPRHVIFDAPPPAFSLLSIPYAALLWKRYYSLTKQTRRVLRSSVDATARANRTRRRLCYMSLVILMIYVPIQMYYLSSNVKLALSHHVAYDFNRIHYRGTPLPWKARLFTPSWDMSSEFMNQAWLSIATTAVIVGFFGTTIEAKKIYRQYAQNIGLEAYVRKLKLKTRPPTTARGNESAGTQESGMMLLPIPVSDSAEYDKEQNLDRSVIVQPGQAHTAAANQPFVPPPAQPGRKIPPIVPPRYSSLRWRFNLPSSTLQSIKDSIRLPSLRGRKASATDTSNKASDGLTMSSSPSGAIPILPLYHGPRPWPEARCSPGSFLARHVQDGISTPRGLAPSWDRDAEPPSLQVRIPIMHQCPLSDGWMGARDSDRVAMGREGAVSRASFSREYTLTSLLTSSDILRTGNIHSSPNDANSGSGG